MQNTGKRLLRGLACATVWMLGAVGTPAQTPPNNSIPVTSAQSDKISNGELTRSQKSRIDRAQHDVDRLTRELSSARERLLTLQAAAVQAAPQASLAPTRGTTVQSISDNFVLTSEGNIVGYKTNDLIVFVRRATRGDVIITGLGTVKRVYSDYMDVEVVAQGKVEHVRPDDELYVVSRSDTPTSLVTCFKSANLMERFEKN